MMPTVYDNYRLTTVFEVREDEGFAKYNMLNLRRGECVGFAFVRNGVAVVVCRLENGSWGVSAKRL